MIKNDSLPLKGICVLDLTRFRAGPTCVRQLSDWGANVMKIEKPDKNTSSNEYLASRNGPDFQNLHRNKKSIVINKCQQVVYLTQDLLIMVARHSLPWKHGEVI